MDDSEKFSKLKIMLEDAYIEYVSKHRRQVSYSEFARKSLGVSPVSFSQWKNGTRLPNYANIIQLSKKLGPKVLELFGYEKSIVIDNPDIIYIDENWPSLSIETKQRILNLIEKNTGKKYI